jgi:hypothetical protein
VKTGKSPHGKRKKLDISADLSHDLPQPFDFSQKKAYHDRRVFTRHRETLPQGRKEATA